MQDFKRYVTRTLPWVILKWAMTADGKIATVAGDNRWISSEESRREVHEERRRSDAVLVGRATVKTDDPELTVRMGVVGRNPTRVVFDSSLHLDPASKVALTAAEIPTWVLHAPGRRPGPEAGARGARRAAPARSRRATRAASIRSKLSAHLRKKGLHRILVEGGPTVHGALFADRLADWARIYIAPLLVGGITAPGPLAGAGCPTLEDAVWLSDVHVRAVSPRGSDLVIEGRITNHRES